MFWSLDYFEIGEIELFVDISLSPFNHSEEICVYRFGVIQR